MIGREELGKAARDFCAVVDGKDAHRAEGLTDSIERAVEGVGISREAVYDIMFSLVGEDVMGAVVAGSGSAVKHVDDTIRAFLLGVLSARHEASQAVAA